MRRKKIVVNFHVPNKAWIISLRGVNLVYDLRVKNDNSESYKLEITKCKVLRGSLCTDFTLKMGNYFTLNFHRIV